MTTIVHISPQGKNTATNARIALIESYKTLAEAKEKMHSEPYFMWIGGLALVSPTYDDAVEAIVSLTDISYSRACKIVTRRCEAWDDNGKHVKMLACTWWRVQAMRAALRSEFTVDKARAFLRTPEGHALSMLGSK